MMMEDADLPMRSPDGLAALDVFYDEFNDIHFFVEDDDQENLYEVVLRKLFPELRIARVFPLGGKQAVLGHSATASPDGTRPLAVYLVDKDFDDFLGLRVSRHFLFYLDRYCIENYFVEPDAVVEVVVESLPKLKRAEITAALDLHKKIDEFAESMRQLFQLFFCVQRFNLGIKNCALPAERFCLSQRRWVIDAKAVANYGQQVVQAASSTTHSDALNDPLAHDEVALLGDLDYHAVVSGKHICTLIFHYLKSKYNIGTITFESFLFRLAKNASMTALQALGEAIRGAVSAARPGLVQVADRAP
jgi:Protein of unknown function (DUF4435)